jgi:hypothetical protein
MSSSEFNREPFFPTHGRRFPYGSQAAHCHFNAGRTRATPSDHVPWPRKGQEAHPGHIVPKAGRSPDGGPAWSDEQISRTFHADVTTGEKARKAFVEDGFEAALEHRKPSRTKPRKCDGDKEDHLIALACSQPPESRNRWNCKSSTAYLSAVEVNW